MKRLTIGVIIGNGNSPHTRTLMKGIEDAAVKKDVNVIFFVGMHMFYNYLNNRDTDMEYNYDYQHNSIFEYSNLAGADAFIISYGSVCIFLNNLDKNGFLEPYRKKPFVLLEDRDDLASGTSSSIIADNYDGMYRICEHLLTTHKYTKFAYLGGPAYNTDAIERKKAFVDALTEHGIELTDDMFEEGDFSDTVGPLVENLLDNNPDIQALVCANDMMANAAYEVCEQRGIKVGRDIAITGYDDWELAATMSPPLTTVVQNEYDVGARSVEKVIELCNGKNSDPVASPAVLKIRNSCGCKQESRYNFPKTTFENKFKAAYVESIIRILVNKTVLYNTNIQIKKEITDFVRPIVTEVVDKVRNGIDSLDKKTLMLSINELLTGRYSTFISAAALLDAIGVLVDSRIAESKDPDRTKALVDTLITIQQQIQAVMIKQNSETISNFENNTSFMPYVSRDMLAYIDKEKEFYRSPMRIISRMNSKSAYFFTLESPSIHKRNCKWKAPDKMYLASYHKGEECFSFNSENRPVITAESGMSKIFDKKRQYIYYVFDIFLGEKQYGALAAEIQLEDLLLINLAGMQISNALDFRDMYLKQQELKTRLENLVAEIESKNKVLSFISEYDQLTGCLNRRGFLEQALTLMSEHEGEKAVLLISDLDHLKEVNDTFGHAAGDYAIRSCTTIIREALGDDTVVARIGGDEFTTICLCGDRTGKEIVERIKAVNTEFNSRCDKPYYVEMSIGYCEFDCEAKDNLAMLMAMADEVLYEDKKLKRPSVRKDNS